MIYLLRHGLDDERYIGGHSDVDLIEEGISQVKDSSKFIKSLNINRIITSDVKRAISSALIVKNSLEGEIAFEVDSRLRELDKGLLTGRLVSSLTDEEKAICNMKDINQRYPDELVKLKFGVYKTRVIFDGNIYIGITDIGIRPTFESDFVISETFVKDYSGDLYGKKIRIEPVEFIREEKKFSGLEELKQQINEDLRRL